jgi:hypothetical protein
MFCSTAVTRCSGPSVLAWQRAFRFPHNGEIACYFLEVLHQLRRNRGSDGRWLLCRTLRRHLTDTGGIRLLACNVLGEIACGLHQLLLLLK